MATGHETVLSRAIISVPVVSDEYWATVIRAHTSIQKYIKNQTNYSDFLFIDNERSLYHWHSCRA